MRGGEGVGSDVVRDPHDPAGVSVLGRLLWVGVVGGLMIGGLAGAVLLAAGDVSDAVGGFSLGAMVGTVVGTAVQLVGAVVLHVARRVRTGLGPAAMRLLLLPLPVAAAVLLPWLLSASGSDPTSVTTTERAAALLAGVLSAAAAWVFAPWFVAPLAPRREHGSR